MVGFRSEGVRKKTNQTGDSCGWSGTRFALENKPGAAGLSRTHDSWTCMTSARRRDVASASCVTRPINLERGRYAVVAVNRPGRGHSDLHPLYVLLPAGVGDVGP